MNTEQKMVVLKKYIYSKPSLLPLREIAEPGSQWNSELAPLPSVPHMGRLLAIASVLLPNLVVYVWKNQALSLCLKKKFQLRCMGKISDTVREMTNTKVVRK